MRLRILLCALLFSAGAAQAQDAKPAWCTKPGEFGHRVQALQRCIAKEARGREAAQPDLDKVADASVKACARLKDPMIDFISLCGGDNGVEVVAQNGGTYHEWGVEAAALFRAHRLNVLKKST